MITQAQTIFRFHLLSFSYHIPISIQMRIIYPASKIPRVCPSSITWESRIGHRSQRTFVVRFRGRLAAHLLNRFLGLRLVVTKQKDIFVIIGGVRLF